jgi:hypothetical protein
MATFTAMDDSSRKREHESGAFYRSGFLRARATFVEPLPLLRRRIRRASRVYDAERLFAAARAAMAALETR